MTRLTLVLYPRVLGWPLLCSLEQQMSRLEHWTLFCKTLILCRVFSVSIERLLLLQKWCTIMSKSWNVTKILSQKLDNVCVRLQGIYEIFLQKFQKLLIQSRFAVSVNFVKQQLCYCSAGKLNFSLCLVFEPKFIFTWKILISPKKLLTIIIKASVSYKQASEYYINGILIQNWLCNKKLFHWKDIVYHLS